MSEADARIQEAARLVALEKNVSAAAAFRLIRITALESGRDIGAVARAITSGWRIDNQSSP